MFAPHAFVHTNPNKTKHDTFDPFVPETVETKNRHYASKSTTKFFSFVCWELASLLGK